MSIRCQHSRCTVLGRPVGLFLVFFSVGKRLSNLQIILDQILKQADELNMSSKALTRISSKLADGTNQAGSQPDSVAAAPDQLNSNMQVVAGASEEASGNVRSISDTVESILASVEEEAQQTVLAQKIPHSAVALPSSSSQKVDALGAAAAEIRKLRLTKMCDRLPLYRLKLQRI